MDTISSINSNNVCVFPSSNRNKIDSRLLTEDRVAKMLSSSPIKAWTIDGNTSTGIVEFVLDGHYYRATGLNLGANLSDDDYIYAEISMNVVTNAYDDPVSTGLYSYVDGIDDNGSSYTGLKIFSRTTLDQNINQITNMNSSGSTKTMLLFENGADHPLAQPTYVLDCGTI